MRGALLGATTTALALGACGFEQSPLAPEWAAMTSGDHHVCAIKGDGTLWCWGDNGQGQAGLGDDLPEVLEPTQVGTATWRTISAGQNFTCGVQMNNTLWCWGRSVESQLGVMLGAGETFAATPQQVAGVYTSVSAGAAHACAITDMSRLACWGNNAYGNLGDGTMTASPAPKTIGTDRWKAIAAGYYTTCGLRENGTLWCWGLNTYGTVGDGTTTNRDAPVQVDGTFTSISLSWLHACAKHEDGRGRCWGYNGHGQLGDGTVISHATPHALGDDTDTWIDIVAGVRNTCGIRADSTLACWGSDLHGALGISPLRASVNAIPTTVDLDFVTGVALGTSHACALVDAGQRLVCSGGNGLGQLGTGDGGSRHAPIQIGGELGEWDLVSAGTLSTCALRDDGSRACWGDNSLGQLGDIQSLSRQVPAIVATGDRVTIAVGSLHACELRGADVWCWGYNVAGQAGDAAAGAIRGPGIVTGVTAKALSARQHTCAIPATGGGLACWGTNTSGQLGRNDKMPHTDITTVFTTDTFAQVAAGAAHTCAVQTLQGASGGELSCWGDNSVGQIGNGMLGEALAPYFQMMTGWSAVAAGSFHSCGIRAGVLQCWGLNTYGQLGEGSRTNAQGPVTVSGGGMWTQVSAGATHTCGIKTDRTLWCWGRNLRGQLGIDTTVDANTPQQVPGTWASVAAGDNHTCGTQPDGSLWCWGSNDAGQVGDGTAWREVW